MKNFFITLGHAAAGGAAVGAANWLVGGNITNWKALIAMITASAVTSAASLWTTSPAKSTTPPAK